MRSTRTRIKWIKIDETRVMSEPVITGSVVVRAFLDTASLTLQVKDLREKYIFAAGKADSLKDLKKTGKDKLIQMGAKFFDEVRLGNAVKKSKNSTSA